MKLTKENRRAIAEAYVSEHGYFDPVGFYEEVGAAGSAHPAYTWFEWDEAAAARAFNVTRAREFVRDLRIEVTLKPMAQSNVAAIVASAPAFLSPLGDRMNGGGYRRTDFSMDLDELAAQAGRELRAWCRRYEAVLIARGIDPKEIGLIGAQVDPQLVVVPIAAE